MRNDNDKADQSDLFEDAPDPKPLSRVAKRLIRTAEEITLDDPEEIVFQHSVFCQTGLPYRNPGDDVRDWERQQGRTFLSVEAGKMLDRETQGYIKIGLPYGPKPRLILAFLNTEALRTRSNVIEVEDSLTAFVKRIGLHSHGRNVNTIKDQLGRLSVSQVRLGILTDQGARQVNGQVVSGFDLWFPKDERQRVLWPSTVQLSLDYFTSLSKHAVPLDERAIAALSHSAMALDLYAWLAYRLHLVPYGKAQFITWKALKDQFGWHYSKMFKFKQVFRQTLRIVLSQYQGARFDLDQRGMTLFNSPPPIKGRMILVTKS